MWNILYEKWFLRQDIYKKAVLKIVVLLEKKIRIFSCLQEEFSFSRRKECSRSKKIYILSRAGKGCIHIVYICLMSVDINRCRQKKV